jgi:peptide deformylase
MKLVNNTDASLRTAQPTYVFNGLEPVIAQQIQEFCKSITNWIVLPAPYIGLQYRMFAFNLDTPVFCFNPKIVDKSSECDILEEMDVLYPGILAKVERSKLIKVRFTNELGQTLTQKFSGLTARYFQQGLDILDGLKYYSRCNYIHRQKIIKKIELINRKLKI